jgi:hypothetical protein
MEFDTIISLGGSCETARHIRRRFGIDRAQVFDWWITPFNAVIDLFDNDFDGLFDPANIFVRPVSA